MRYKNFICATKTLYPSVLTRKTVKQLLCKENKIKKIYNMNLTKFMVGGGF